MATIETAGTVQAGVTAPALVDPQAQPREPAERKPVDSGSGGGDAAVVEFSSQAQVAAVPAAPRVDQDTDSGVDTPDRGDLARKRAESTTNSIRESASSLQTNRRTAFDAENGQIEIRSGDEVVREIPSEEVVRIRESIAKFKQAQENLDITA